MRCYFGCISFQIKPILVDRFGIYILLYFYANAVILLSSVDLLVLVGCIYFNTIHICMRQKLLNRERERENTGKKTMQFNKEKNMRRTFREDHASVLKLR